MTGLHCAFQFENAVATLTACRSWAEWVRVSDWSYIIMSNAYQAIFLEEIITVLIEPVALVKTVFRQPSCVGTGVVLLKHVI